MLKTVNCSVLVLPFVLFFTCSLLACSGPGDPGSPNAEPLGSSPAEIPTGTFSEEESDWSLPDELIESGEEESSDLESPSEQEESVEDVTFDGEGDLEEAGPTEAPSSEEDEISAPNFREEIEEEAPYDCETGDEQDCTTECGTEGTQTCVKSWGECVPPIEVCNDLDDDCNGLIDDLANGESCEPSCDPNAVDWNPDPDCPKPGQELCEDVLSESAYCITYLPGKGLTWRDSALAYVGLDTGTVCQFLVTDSYGSPSIAWVGNTLYYCSAIYGQGYGQGHVIGVNLQTGISVPYNWSCDALTGYQNGLLLMTSVPSELHSLQFFSTVEDFQAGTFEEYALDLGTANRLTTNGDRLFTTGQYQLLDEFALPSGEFMGSHFLNVFEGGVQGLSAMADGRVAFLDLFFLTMIGVENGGIPFLNSFPFGAQGQELMGLDCVTNP